MSYYISRIKDILSANYLQQGIDVPIEHLITDSRKLLFPGSVLFFALKGQGRSGADFVAELYKQGLRNFVVQASEKLEIELLPGTNILAVEDVLRALQMLGAYHRRQFHFPVIGITGSNGKTIVKEWLNQLLGDDHNIVRSPKSYNSQVGVPLSVWRMHESNDLGIFESGISQPGEMKNLQEIIDPEIGIVTFIGSAHAEGFDNIEKKIQEKLQLFTGSRLLIFCADDEKLYAGVKLLQNTNPGLKTFLWSFKTAADLRITGIQKGEEDTLITGIFKNETFSFKIFFTDDASIHNAITCCSLLLSLQISTGEITARMLHLRPVEMRLELKQGLNNCSVINDGYSADLSSLAIALDFLSQQQQHTKRTVILSDVLQAGKNKHTLYEKIAGLLAHKNIDRLVGIGEEISSHASLFSAITDVAFFNSTEAFLQQIHALHFRDETILLKGARVFRFEKISHVLEQRVHETLLEINLHALRHNLDVYRRQLLPGVKIMAMVKAFSYGSGSFEIANLLQHAGVEYLAVAYADEGADLRRAGISLPIMVMNTESASFENLLKYKLEPEIYSFNILNDFRNYLQERNMRHYPVHIKIDTGMHRLGFEKEDIQALCKKLSQDNYFRIVSVFSHLAGSDAAEHDSFTRQQANDFATAADAIRTSVAYDFFRHIANSSAVFRHPALQLDMVRLGIGLYGIDASLQMQHQLRHVTVLKTTISQVRTIKGGESIGYSRKGVAQHDARIATVRIGYADGYPRTLSNGKGKMLVNGSAAPVIGNICMDMTMLDVTGIEADEGDEVIVFGESPTVSDVATWAETISYEILTNISQRVKRVYFDE